MSPIPPKKLRAEPEAEVINQDEVDRIRELLQLEGLRAQREGRERDLRQQKKPLQSYKPVLQPGAMSGIEKVADFMSVPLNDKDNNNNNDDDDDDDDDEDSELWEKAKEQMVQAVSSDKVHPFWKNPLDGNSLRGGIDRRMTELQQIKWLKSSANWPDIEADDWRGIKVLGMGGYGLVGLWKYIGSDPDVPKAIVVKQSPRYDRNLEDESDFLERLNVCESKHVPKLLRGFHTAKGGGSSDWDPDGDVSRIYLEYCEHGDMAGFIKKMYKRYSVTNPMPEAYIWRIFECLALALCVLAHGNEDLEGPGWNIEICHFDIKPQNILIGACDKDHPYTGVFKLADYGLAMRVPKHQPPSWLRDHAHRGTPGWLSIEQMMEHTITNRRYGTHTNIWVIALCMYSLIMRGRVVDTTKQPSRDIYGSRFKTVGVQIERTQYSKDLKDTILWCLAVDPHRRPEPRQLVKHIQSIIKEQFPDVPVPDDPLHADEAFLQGNGLPTPDVQSISSLSLAGLPEQFGRIDMANVPANIALPVYQGPSLHGRRDLGMRINDTSRRGLASAGSQV
ncbi:hypothetical protein B7463_g1376, partial [Scytalidium lignicola]